MATSPGKTAVLVLLVLLLIFMFLRVTPLFIAPMGFLSGITRAIRFPDLTGCFDGSFRFLNIPLSVAGLFMLVLWIAVILWIYRDAESRGMNGLLWALLVFIGNLIALIVYLIVRSETDRNRSAPSRISCPDCDKSIEGQYAYCPYCGAAVRNVCPSCNTELQRDWVVCPKCGAKLKEGK